MAHENDRPAKLAVLIDADNASSRTVSGLFEEIATIGEASVRRIYGDFSGSRLKAWADVLSTHGIVPHQNFATTSGKNASDIALVIDAMDLLHTGRFDAFCLVSATLRALPPGFANKGRTYTGSVNARRPRASEMSASGSSTRKT